MYPGVIIDYDDQSEYRSLPITDIKNKPLMVAVFTSDKGPEEWTRVSGSDFFKLYGENISFKKHGQPLLQAAMCINRGAELLCKRLVDSDATYANIGIFVSVVNDSATGSKMLKYSIHHVDEATPAIDIESAMKVLATKDEHLLYTIVDTGRGVSDKRIKINANYKTSKSQSYVSYTLTVSGRMSKPETFTFSVNPYLIVNSTNISLQNMVNANSSQIKCYENIEGLEWLATELADPEYSKDILFACDTKGQLLPGFVDDNSTNPIKLNDDSGIALAGGTNGKYGNAPISTYTEPEKDKNGNVLFTDGVDDYSVTINTTTEETDGVTTTTITTVYTNTTNDKKGYTVVETKIGENTVMSYYNTPSVAEDTLPDVSYKSAIDSIKEKESETLIWENDARAAFQGLDDVYKSIYNVDQHKIVAIVDANYPDNVKMDIQALADFREDFMYIRDMGLGVTSLDIAKTKAETDSANSKFSATYYQSYDIIDPYSRRQVPVTICYDLALLLIDHFDRGLINPTAGIKHNMIIENAIYGTVSHIPTIYQKYENTNTIEVNEKEQLCDAKINFASYIDNRLVVETLYTTQEKDSQWSYINNVMGIQEVIRAIRTHCPAIRYSFISGDDLEKYKKDVNEIIEPYRSSYMSLDLEYVADAQYTANKIFYAVLKVKYKEFEQTEWFRVTALATETTIVE